MRGHLSSLRLFLTIFESTRWHDPPFEINLSSEVESTKHSCIVMRKILWILRLYYDTASMVLTLDPHRTVLITALLVGRRVIVVDMDSDKMEKVPRKMEGGLLTSIRNLEL